ncbi:MAG: hypothetical protein KUG80_02595 [Gammaproteobacteria bacterium]|nr:hypothetical protein [Gammaproteobacteria bacterium]
MKESTKNIENIAILTMDCLYTTIYLNSLVSELSGRVKIIFISDRIGKKYGSASKQGIDHFKQSGIKFILYLLAVHGFHKPLFFIRNVLWRIANRPQVLLIKELAKKYNIEVMMVKDVNSEGVKNKLYELNTDLLISAYFDQILHQEVFEIPEHGTINFHPGYLPSNPGPAPTFWAVSENRSIGSTVHFIDSGIDTGNIIVREKISEDSSESVIGLEYRIFSKAHVLTLKAISMIEDNTLNAIPADEDREYRSYPTRSAFVKLKTFKKCYFTFSDYYKYFK